jgi:hypothetical protein
MAAAAARRRSAHGAEDDTAKAPHPAAARAMADPIMASPVLFFERGNLPPRAALIVATHSDGTVDLVYFHAPSTFQRNGHCSTFAGRVPHGDESEPHRHWRRRTEV